MESKRAIVTHAVVLAASFLAACAQTPSVAISDPVASASVMRLGVTQVGAGQQARYVFCEVESCPQPTPKTRPMPYKPLNTVVEKPQPVVVFVDFPFNSAHISDKDRAELLKAMQSNKDKSVEITARSDFVGPKKAQRRIAKARARAIKSVLATQAQGVRIVEHHEIAGPNPVPAHEQARQRQGTVRFTSTPATTLQGEK